MSYKIETGHTFDTQLKQLAKKYRSIKAEVAELAGKLSDNPAVGTPIGKSCYKIRLAIKSKGQGKRVGARVITCVVAVDERVYCFRFMTKPNKVQLSRKR